MERKMFRSIWIKFFIVLLIVSLFALSAAYILRELMIRDFRYYLEGEMEDKVYRVIANIEGSYEKYSGWNIDSLNENTIWALMLGLEIKIKDLNNRIIIDTETAFNKLSPSMQRRIKAITDIGLISKDKDFSPYPLFISGKEIGRLEVRFLYPEKEFFFIERSNRFLLFSLFAVGCAVTLFSIIFSRKLTEPIKKLDYAASAISAGDLKSRVEIAGSDEIKRLSETFNKMAENLEKQDLLRKKLISNVAHELRTPITVIKGEVEGMMDGLVPADKEHLLSLYEEINRIKKILDGIEDISQAEVSAMWIKKQKIHLKPFLKSIVERFSRIFIDKGINFEFINGEEIELNADPDRISQIVINLLSNALKATERGGNIWVKTGKHDSEVFIEIGDTGHGIKPDDLPYIFERFYKVSEGGLGLGLSIAKELAEAHGGRIVAKSTYGKGSSFTVFIPY
ncbi:MAG: HAMP domain-containing histidine kinase [Nitrospirae bacterium]|nr:HAMP domain-containing histidine kinase [Nitrospirota bacterium]